jgi:hypothetical protein
MQEAQTPGLHVAPRRHAGKAADVVAVEGDGALCEPVEIWGRYPRAAVAAQHVTIKRVEEEEDEAHGLS